MEIYPWGHPRRYNDYPGYIKKVFGGRVQKISVNVGFSCPNRDGTKGFGGCIYCDNKTFRPGYCEPEKPVKEQVLRGVGFFEEKYPDMNYLAYFQSYTNTYAPANQLWALYREAVAHEKVAGLIIGTRPDCINQEIIEVLKEIALTKPVTVEFGLESTNDQTLKEINRCHTWKDSVKAIELCNKNGIEAGVHLILGLPGESRVDMLNHARLISDLPVKTLKLHQLQVIKNTVLARRFAENPEYVKLFNLDDYIDFVIDFIEQLSPEIIIERFVGTSPVEKLIAPKWNKTKNFEVVAKIEKRLKERDTFQGRLYGN